MIRSFLAFLRDTDALVYVATAVMIFKVAVLPDFNMSSAAVLLTALLAHAHAGNK